MCVYVILQQGEPPDGAAAGEAPDGAGLLVPDRSKRRVDDGEDEEEDKLKGACQVWQPKKPPRRARRQASTTQRGGSIDPWNWNWSVVC